MKEQDHITQRAVLESFGCPVAAFDDHAVIVMCNSECEQLLGIGAGQACGHRLSDFGLRIIDEGGEPCFDWRFPLHQTAGQKKESTAFIFGLKTPTMAESQWFSATLKPGQVGQEWGNLTFMTLTDVTAIIRKNQVHAQIFQAKNEWETTVDALKDIVTIQDRDMRIVRANKAAHELFGYKLGELKGKKCYESFLGRKEPCVGCPVKKTGEDCCPHAGTTATHLLF